MFRYPSLRGTFLILTMTPCKPDDLSSTPGTHILKKKKWTWWHPSVIPALLCPDGRQREETRQETGSFLASQPREAETREFVSEFA